jgi:hypothetical protein
MEESHENNVSTRISGQKQFHSLFHFNHSHFEPCDALAGLARIKTDQTGGKILAKLLIVPAYYFVVAVADGASVYASGSETMLLSTDGENALTTSNGLNKLPVRPGRMAWPISSNFAAQCLSIFSSCGGVKVPFSLEDLL